MTLSKRLLVSIALVALSGAALAQQGQGQGQGQGRGQPGMGPVAAQCNDDVAKLCAGKEHGGGAVRECLEANVAKVTDPCKAALNSTGARRRQP